QDLAHATGARLAMPGSTERLIPRSLALPPRAPPPPVTSGDLARRDESRIRLDVMRVVFFGTPGFAVPSLGALIDSGFDVPLVVTQPDRPVGRSGRPRPSPVADAARERGIPVETPERLRGNDAFFERLS